MGDPAVNKSLSALGNVISALSAGEKFIPYRDNKRVAGWGGCGAPSSFLPDTPLLAWCRLTQLLSDALGGNAKTLAMICVSPVDYNVEESISSLVYASRMKLITNAAEKQQGPQHTGSSILHPAGDLSLPIAPPALPPPLLLQRQLRCSV